MQVKKLVVDGPPCSGKSTIMAKLIEHFSALNFPVVTVPEAATELITNGVTPSSFVDENLFQKCLVEKIIANEDFFGKMLERMNNPYNKEGLMFCDRGKMTGFAYCDPVIFSSILLGTDGVSSVEEVLSSYEGVLHMRVAPREYYTCANNSARTESYPEACDLDDKTLRAWRGHPNLMIIGNDYEGGFAGKINAALQAVSRLLRVPQPLVLEKKFLLSNPNDLILRSLFDLCSAVRVRIFQDYLAGNEEESVRAWTRESGATIYFHRKKSNAPGVERFCQEKIIDKTEYERLLTNADPACKTIKKTRYYFVYGDQYFRLDIFDDIKEYLLEIQPTLVHQEIQIPEFFGEVRDVTDDYTWYNYHIARSISDRKMFRKFISDEEVEEWVKE